MQTLNFDTIAAGWNQIRTSGAPNLKAAVSGLVDPSHIILQRVGESPTTLTVMFKGFDQALETIERDGPILKRALFAWIRKFAAAQIVRGDPETFTILIRKPQPDQPAAAPPMQTETVNRGKLVRISNMRKLNG